MKNKCTMLVSSCDKYEDTWYPFFEILKNNWPTLDMPIVLNTESKKYEHNGLNIQCLQLYSSEEKVAWGQRLIETLKKIETEYILFMLDDFFILDEVDDSRIKECISWMDENKNIAVFSFLETPGKNIRDNKYLNFEKRPQNGEYRLNCQAAIWRKDLLLKYIRPHESPWDWEIYGSIRSSRYHEDFYSYIGNKNLIINYNFKEYGVIRGKWAMKTIDLFKKYDINIDFKKRGFVSEEKKNNEIYYSPFFRFLIKVRSYFLISEWKHRYIKYLSTKK